jgi:hypothetical protein
VKPPQPLHSETFAWLAGGLVIAVAAQIAFLYLGWFGLCLIGVLGMTVTMRMDLHGGHAIADQDYGSSSVEMYARQLRQADNASPEEKQAAAADKAKRQKMIYILNTLWMALIGFGLAMFFTHQI